MAPANQGSKAALITWTVVATVFGIVMAVLALLFFANANTYRQDLEQVESDYADVVAPADLAGAGINELKDAARAQGQAGSVFNYLTYREQQLASRAAGTSDFSSASSAIDQKLAQLASAEESPITATSLMGAVDQLQGRLTTLRQEMQGLQQANAGLQTSLANQQSVAQQQLAAKDTAIESLSQQTQEATAQLSEFQQAATNVTNKVDTVIAEMGVGFGETQEGLQNQLSDLRAENDRLNRDRQRLTEILSDRFQGDQMLTSADGQVLRSPSEGRLYINLGRNESITNGMTFEVYDSVLGIPKMESDDALPRGKGSIQIIRVLPNSAEARIIATTPGQVIREGDLIANLAYDPNVPVRFRIYGDFDLNNDGRVDERDRDRIESLVREFGSEVVPQVTVETDLLVMGQEPQLPDYSEEERRIDSQKAAEYERARQRFEAYRNVIEQAQSLNKPILNQNQFLYYIGYFDQSRL